MGMVILFRDSGNESHFKRAFLDLIKHAPGDTLIIASGYVSALVTVHVKKFIQVDGKWVPKEWGTPYVSEIVSAIKSNNNIKKLIFCAGDFNKHNAPEGKCKDNKNSRHYTHNGDCHLCDYEYGKKMFIQELKKQSVNLESKFIQATNWHAKFTIKVNSKDKSPSAILLGSSNLSGHNFSERTKYFKNECDIYIWDGKLYSSEYTPSYKNFNLFSLAVSPSKPVNKILQDMYSHFGEGLSNFNDFKSTD